MFCQFVPAEPKRKRGESKSDDKSKKPVSIGAPDIHRLQCNQCLSSSTAGTPFDTITFEQLEQRYVEWVSPDQKLKCCYNASTLGRIRSDQGHMMQPPHFRIPMSGADAQKISEAFGIPLVNQPVDRIQDTTVQTRVNDNRILLQWANTTMESVRDLFICPICWTQLTCGTLQKTSEQVTEARISTNPMRVFFTHIITRYAEGRDGSAELASFCRPTKTELKQHLREAHGIQRIPAPLLDVYRLRGMDGLLHRYLLHNDASDKSAHGKLLSYWRIAAGFYKFLFVSVHGLTESTSMNVSVPLEAQHAQTLMDVLSAPYSLRRTSNDNAFIDDSEDALAAAPMPLGRSSSVSSVDDTIDDYDARGDAYERELQAELEEERRLQALRQAAGIRDLSSSESESEEEEAPPKRRLRRKSSSSESDSEDGLFTQNSTTNQSGRRALLEESDSDSD